MTRRVAEGLPLLEQVQLQAEVLLPVIHRLRAELGVTRANALVAEALREWQRSVHERAAAEAPGEAGWAKLGAMTAAKMPAIGDAITVEWGKVDLPNVMEFKITRCAFAEFFRALGEPELGGLLTCEGDLYEVAAAGGEIELTRPQTIMQGAAYCDFKYAKRRK
ncbi:MAG TPA: L-2-amino-thiazoline-4-carboxylic acid hydrolase [Burkholderiales bacterium]|nr:L-2-amino-thiazoline-4-carboxylic acid hydrolase [Burkholderiales bacterium]